LTTPVIHFVLLT